MAKTQGESAAQSLPAWADLPAYRADYRQRNPIPDPDQVIADLAARPQWLMWRYEPGDEPTSKPRKMPYWANRARRVGTQGSEQDRAHLATYETAAIAAREAGFDGVGFAFLPGDGLIGIDLDGMIDPASGEISPRCAEIIAACASYTEFSPSGKGVHILCAADGIDPEQLTTFKSNKIGVEVFTGRQYFTFTGRTWPGSAAELKPLDAKVFRRLKATVRKAKAPVTPPAEPESVPVPSTPPAANGRQRSLAETVSLAEEALKHLCADDYHLWIEIGLACKAGLGNAGYLVWDAWSATGKEYPGEAETQRRWKTFKPTETTLGKVFALAEEAGWVSPWAKAKARRKARPHEATRKSARPRTNDDAPAAISPATSGPPGAPPPLTAPAGGSGEPPDDDWELDLLRKRNEVSTCLANVELILMRMTEWKGVIGYDEFAERTVFRKPLPFDRRGRASGDWTDHLDVMTAIWLQRQWNVEFAPTTIGQAIEAVARQQPFHPVREALRSLPPWDGIRRNSEWLSDYLGVKRTEYSARVGSYFLRGMIYRVMQPGCKFDYCLILEGEQGRGKSTVARILSWRWFADTDLDLSNKDSLLALPGHWVYEIAEMGSLMKAEERKQKSFLSRQEDEYRPPYGRRLIKVPRQSVFIGTTNEEEYLKDATGARRFWPVLCGESGELNLEGLRENLSQMLAEALADYEAGERSYPTKEEEVELFVPEQAQRGMPEPFDDLLWRWVEKQAVPFSMADAAADGLSLSPDKLTPAIVTRIGTALRRLGCIRRENRHASPDRRRLYMTPEMVKQEMRAARAAAAGEKPNDTPF